MTRGQLAPHIKYFLFGVLMLLFVANSQFLRQTR
jgi:hypothetical protein